MVDTNVDKTKKTKFASKREIILDKIGLETEEREDLFCKSAEAATDTGFVFWMLVIISGAIATLGLIQNSTAVVIGAMLVAPMLGPLLGISLSLSSGDTRLFVQTGMTVVLAGSLIVCMAALITLAMPIVTITDEIVARTKPTVLDLAIAVASGTAASVIVGSRNKRLSGSIPGVAVAVALVPPLGAAGFGLGYGFDWDIFRGAMLLFGANLAGIVFSALLVFSILGIARKDVTEVARDWHKNEKSTGFAAWVDSLKVVSILPLGNARVSILLSLTFTVLLSVPLTASFNQIVRDTRIGKAADSIVATIKDSGVELVARRKIDSAAKVPVIHLLTVGSAEISEKEVSELGKKASEIAGERIEVEISQQLVNKPKDFIAE